MIPGSPLFYVQPYAERIIMNEKGNDELRNAFDIRVNARFEPLTISKEESAALEPHGFSQFSNTFSINATVVRLGTNEPAGYLGMVLREFAPNTCMSDILLLSRISLPDTYEMLLAACSSEIFRLAFNMDDDMVLRNTANGYFCEIRTLYVLPEYRNRGIGTFLLSHTKDIVSKVTGRRVVCEAILPIPVYYGKHPSTEGKVPLDAFEKCKWYRTRTEPERTLYTKAFVRKAGFTESKDTYMFKGAEDQDREGQKKKT